MCQKTVRSPNGTQLWYLIRKKNPLWIHFRTWFWNLDFDREASHSYPLFKVEPQVSFLNRIWNSKRISWKFIKMSNTYFCFDQHKTQLLAHFIKDSCLAIVIMVVGKKEKSKILWVMQQKTCKYPSNFSVLFSKTKYG